MKPPYELTFSVEFITPEQATAWLDNLNVFNRPKKRRLIDKIARDIEADRFKLNGEPIIFANENGQLLDGQNRLAAIAQSGKGVWSAVVRGVPKNCFDTIDGGAPRTFADLLGIAGEKNAKTLQTTLVLSCQIAKSGYPDKNFPPTFGECEECLDKNGIIKAHVQRIHDQGKLLLPRSLAAALLFHFNEADANLASQWLDAVTQNTADSDNFISSQRPFVLMRDALIDNLGSRKKLMPLDLWTLAVMAWNAVIEGKELKRLVLPKKGAQVPRLGKKAPQPEPAMEGQ